MLLKAHQTLGGELGLEIVPAHPQRDWMTATPVPGPVDKDTNLTGFANRCLPLLMANQLGWNLVSTRSFVMTSMPTGFLLFHWEERPAQQGMPRNNFGNNLCTWPLPWLFETPPGWDLLVVPPPNKYLPAGVTCLTGLVETDHAITTFTANWRVEPGLSVWVKAGDPIATLIPYPTDQLGEMRLEIDSELPEGYEQWRDHRQQATQNTLRDGAIWEKFYWDRAKRRKLKRA